MLLTPTPSLWVLRIRGHQNSFFRFEEGSTPIDCRYFVTVRRAIRIPWLRRISRIFSCTDLEAMSSLPPSRFSPELKKNFSSKIPWGVYRYFQLVTRDTGDSCS